MTEREKAAAGFLYDANYDEELARQLAECKDKCHRYNLCLPSDTAQQDEIMRGILGKAGNGLRITAPFWCDYGYNIFVGDDFYSNHNLVILDCAPITFGDHVFIAPNCCFSAAGHPLAGDSLYGAELPCPSGFLLHHGRVSLPDFQAFRLPAWLPLLPREAQEKATAFLGMEEE